MAKSSIRPPDEVIVNDPSLKTLSSEDYSVESRIRPPDEVIVNDPFVKSAESEESTKSETKISTKWLIAVISIAVGLEFISWIIPTGSSYTLLWYPLLISINCINFAVFFIYCCYVYGLNRYLKITGFGYLSLNVLSILGVLIPFNSVTSIISISNSIITIGCVIILIVACTKKIVDITVDE